MTVKTCAFEIPQKFIRKPSEGITTLIIQFNYGFFNFSKFSDFILELKKDNLHDKVRMQEEFIGELDKRGKETIHEKEEKLNIIALDVDKLLKKNETLNQNLVSVQKQLETVSDASQRLQQLGSLKQKIGNKVSSILGMITGKKNK